MSDKPVSDKPAKQISDADELQQEIRKERKFSLSEAIGRLAGPGAMKGASPVSRKQQAEFEIETWLKDHLLEAEGALRIVLQRDVSGSQLLLNNYDQALIVLAGYCQQVLNSDARLKELVRDSDAEWGRMFGERPYFDVEGSTPHPDDPYTADSVRKSLSRLIEQLGNA
jgi:hypothetical protein